jgi:hypothetical protein
MNAVQGYLEKLGGNFMIAAFIPSLAFVTACMVAFSPLLPLTLIDRIRTSLSPLGENSLIILLIATVMGFTLTSLNTYIYKLFEGYIFPNFLSPFHKLERAHARKIRSQRDSLDRKVKRIESWKLQWENAKMPKYQKQRFERIEKRIKQIKNKRDSLASEYDLKYPPFDNMILPTRLGNILRAAEVYSQDRYHVDAVALWPRMVWAIDKEFMGHVDTANDQCSFLLNSSLLSGIFAALAFCASFYEAGLFYTQYLKIPPPHNIVLPPTIADFIPSILSYVLLGLVTLGIAWFFYTASLINVSKYGNLIRSSYDLFRFNLLEKLHLGLPANNQKEKELWDKVSEFITIGERYGEQFFEYPSHGDDEAEIRTLLSKAGISVDKA